MNIDVEKLADRAVDLQVKLKAVAAARTAGFGEGNYYFNMILELAIDTIEAIGFLSAGGDVTRLRVRAQILAIRVAALRAFLGDQGPDAFLEDLFGLASDTHDALTFLVEVGEEVDKATGDDPDQAV